MNTGCLMCSAAALALMTACGASVEPPPVSTTMARIGPAPAVPDERAVQEIAAARCEHDLGCNEIGRDKTWSSYAECTSAVGATSGDLIGQSCRKGVDPSMLTRCIDATQYASCDPPVAARGVTHCLGIELCRW
jgi:hypothetical protein